MSYEFPITEKPVAAVKKSIHCCHGNFIVRAENLPVESPRPIEIYIGDGEAYDDHMLLHLHEFRALVNSLEALCLHWEDGGE